MYNFNSYVFFHVSETEFFFQVEARKILTKTYVKNNYAILMQNY